MLQIAQVHTYSSQHPSKPTSHLTQRERIQADAPELHLQHEGAVHPQEQLPLDFPLMMTVTITTSRAPANPSANSRYAQ